MDTRTIIIFLVCFIFIGTIDFFYVYPIWKNWIKKGTIFFIFPHWKGTKKPFVWSLIWSSAILFNIVIYLTVSLICQTTRVFGVLTLGSLIFYLPFVGIVYLLVKWNLQAHYKKIRYKNDKE